MKNPPKYPPGVFWSDEDEGYIAIAPELPGCSAWGETEADVLGEISHTMKAWLEAAKKVGNPIPILAVPAAPAASF